ncbi:MAG: hypothetical protein K2L82_17785 [Lachnospiraceae bacterium]|nr:hypothetical protein [Lachnospiraceae bacterium]
MVSYAGEAAVSEVSLVNQLNNVFIFVFGAVASGGAVVASQYIGRNDRENGVTASSQLLMITVLISAFLMGISILFRSQILSLLFGRVEPDVMRASLTYLVISALSFPALAVYNSAAALFRSMGKTKAIMNISIVMNAINVIGNAIGIFVLQAWDIEAADYYNKKLLRITYMGSAAWNLLIMILTPFVLTLYSLLDDTKKLVILLVVIHSVCRVIFSIAFGVWMNLEVIGICLAMVGDWMVKAALIQVRYRSRKWTKFQVID